MNDDRSHPFRDSHQDREAAHQIPDTPQTRAQAYRLAYDDQEFMCRDELRPVRWQLELMKPELLMQEYGVESTVVLFGGARIPEPAQKDTARTETLAELSRFYDEARELARLITENTRQNEQSELVVITGGGPGIMEAANRGAHDAGGKSIGLNIVLPFEQRPNPYITPELCFQFHYFAIRKMHFLKRARALISCPGGFGTLDELFETLTLIQTRKIKPVPIILLGQDYWQRLINFDVLVDEGTIDEKDLKLFSFAETASEAWQVIRDYYSL